MGSYDYMTDRDQVSQVKCFDCEMRDFKPGDQVPIAGSYSIALAEGGWANIDGGVFMGIFDEPHFDRRIDKWGSTYDPECYGAKHPYKPIWSILVSEEGHF